MSSKQGFFKKVANKKDFQKANLLRVEPDSKPIVLSVVDSNIYAMDAICMFFFSLIFKSKPLPKRLYVCRHDEIHTTRFTE